MAAVISMRELLEAGVHFGHQTNRWNPKMKPYIFGARNKVYILDLQQTQKLFDSAYKFIVNVVASGKDVLFVGTKRQAQEAIMEESERSQMFCMTNRWLGGTLTNFQTIKKSIDRMKKLEELLESDIAEGYTKKELLKMGKQRIKLEKNLGGIKNMERLPGVVFVVDTNKERIPVLEARKLHIPVVAIVDTNCDPNDVDFVIPGNDDAIRAIRLFTSKVADACLEGRAQRQERFVTPNKPQDAGGRMDYVAPPSTGASDFEVIIKKGRTPYQASKDGAASDEAAEAVETEAVAEALAVEEPVVEPVVAAGETASE